MAKSVFYSFHYQRDAWRVQQVSQIGALEGQQILKAQEWEEVKRKGDKAIEKWIADQMTGKGAVVVLVGAETASRPWVKHEIIKAWNDKKPLVGVRIHGLANGEGSTDTAGTNPFAQIKLPSGEKMSDYVTLHTPAGMTSKQVYADITANITDWVDGAYKRA